VSAWISPDGVGHYAFVEFRSAQEATNGLALNGASLFGYQLKLGRPKQYIEYNKQLLSEMGTDRNLETILKKVASLGNPDLPLIEEKIVCPPSTIIILKHIVSI
jgi:splicing factor U2AF subunit